LGRGWGRARAIPPAIVPGHQRIILIPKVEALLSGFLFGLEQKVFSIGTTAEELGIDHSMTFPHHLEVDELAPGVDFRHHAPVAVGIGFSELKAGASRDELSEAFCGGWPPGRLGGFRGIDTGKADSDGLALVVHA
jgi:hypothetical protein